MLSYKISFLEEDLEKMDEAYIIYLLAEQAFIHEVNHPNYYVEIIRGLNESFTVVFKSNSTCLYMREALPNSIYDEVVTLLDGRIKKTNILDKARKIMNISNLIKILGMEQIAWVPTEIAKKM